MRFVNLGDMRPKLKLALKKYERLAFIRAADCRQLITAFCRLDGSAKAHPGYPLLCKLYEWLFVPLTLWPVDVRGFCKHVLDRIQAGGTLDAAAELLYSFLPVTPAEEVCGAVQAYEHAVKTGSYESLIHAQYKFDSREIELSEDPEFKADWKRIADHFDVRKFQDSKGIIRRRMAQERNFRPSDWEFTWTTEKDQFQITFDAFCYRWVLYGMEGERPLLLKLTVNLTPLGTLIFIPRYWSFDHKRDLNWKAITKLHRTRRMPRQGPKLSKNEVERWRERQKAQRLWKEASDAGLKGDARKQWVKGKLGWHPSTDDSRLRRLLAKQEHV